MVYVITSCAITASAVIACAVMVYAVTKCAVIICISESQNGGNSYNTEMHSKKTKS